MSRSGTLPLDALFSLSVAGCSVIAVSADCSSAAAMHSVLGWAAEELPSIDHFAHAAGVPGFTMLQDMSVHEFYSVSNVKVLPFERGAVLLWVNCVPRQAAVVACDPTSSN